MYWKIASHILSFSPHFKIQNWISVIVGLRVLEYMQYVYDKRRPALPHGLCNANLLQVTTQKCRHCMQGCSQTLKKVGSCTRGLCSCMVLNEERAGELSAIYWDLPEKLLGKFYIFSMDT